MPLTCLSFIIVILSVFSLLRNRSTRTYQEKQNAFWEKERQANSVRKKDISNLDYIQIPLDTFPIGKYSDEELLSAENTLVELSGQKILNLSGISNTDLKLMYGVANLNALSEYDFNYTVLARATMAYGKRLAELEHPKDAIAVLEFGIQCHTDVSANYTLLAKLYQQTGQAEKIHHLVQSAQSLDSLMKNYILRELDNAS